jgi:YVTN family beta-propeller protein
MGDEGLQVNVMDITTNNLAGIIPLSSRARGLLAGALAISPDGKTVFASDGTIPLSASDITNDAKFVAIPRELPSVDVNNSNCTSLAVTPDGQHLWVGLGAGLDAGQIAVYDTVTFAKVGEVLIAGHSLIADQVTFAPDGSRAYIAQHDLLTSGIYLSVVDPATLTTLAQIADPADAGSLNLGVAVAVNGERVYITHAGKIAVIDPLTNQVMTEITVGSLPVGIAVAKLPGDLNTDGRVDCADLAIVKASFGRATGQQGFAVRADTNGDGIVDIRDLAFVARRLPAGTKCP